MKSLEEIKKHFTIITTFKGSGHYRVDVIYDYKSLGSYLETDMEHKGDIDELDNGFENELLCSESFEEVYETTLNRLLRENRNDFSPEDIENIEGLIKEYF